MTCAASASILFDFNLGCLCFFLFLCGNTWLTTNRAGSSCESNERYRYRQQNKGESAELNESTEVGESTELGGIYMNLRMLRARIVNVEFLRWGKWASNLLNTAWAGNMCLLAFLVVFLETFTIFVSGVSLYVQHDRTNWSHSLICAYFPNEGKSFKRFNGKTLISPCYSVVKKNTLEIVEWCDFWRNAT